MFKRFHMKQTFLFGFIILIITFLYSIGVLDYFRQKPFNEFEWEPYHIDVRRQVILQITGNKPEINEINSHLKYLILPSCDGQELGEKRSILIIVKSAPNRYEYRKAIRDTWGKQKNMLGFKIRTIFVMGNDINNKKNIEDEYEINQDLLVGDFIDDYRNNTLKLILSFDLAKNYCNLKNPIPFYLFIDDDYYLSIENLISEVKYHIPSERLYMGYRFDSTPFRITLAKHHISLSEYPFSRWPPYISAGAVLLTNTTLSEFYYASKYVKTFKFDDIYTGIIAYLLGITPIHNEKFAFWKSNAENDDFKITIAHHGFDPIMLRNRWIELHNLL
ncbi:Beta-1,3-galactosyltransferase brn [Strongyloides ratti]|uniref:Hexosyltransferase n=1 Tax=Strongyloides ratti TaxID=34506 RepID=A0A090L6X5_STRRB|nr:Beta-1,3-galactosyltransferase brn [Strongyloides ratti]CEF63219.1 Beta-1,3-galactosyltransferase brn [Strongyloides ratti]